jgi:hypothetical protein
MIGGLGGDSYIVANLSDVVDETGGSGVDLVRSSVNFNLAAANSVGRSRTSC